MPKPYHRNPRRIKKDRFDRLNDTLARLGDLGGIVHNLRTDEIIGGNQRTAVFGEASEVQIIEQYDSPDEQGTVAHGFIIWRGKKYSYRQVDWDEETAAEANIAANIGAGEWDWGVIANEWQPAELMEWGFDDSLLDNWRLDVASLGNFLESEEEESRDAVPQIDRAAELQKEWGTAVGQLWRMESRTPGNYHLLICGDCTDEGVVDRVMGGDVPLLMVTDPPYGVEYDPHWRDGIVGDFGVATANGDGAINDDTASWIGAYKLFGGDVSYIWHSDRFNNIVRGELEGVGFEVRNQIVWAKQHYPISRGHYHSQHEPCWYAVRNGKTAHWLGGRDKSTLWEISSLNPAGRKEDKVSHGNQKPIECMARPIRNHDAPIVYDPFLGSGTTLIAAENLSRQARCIEIAPGYTAVALQRYLDAFNITAELIDTI